MADRVGQQLGHYRLLRVLGEGAFAVVYLGEHQYLERPAALKVLHAQMKPDSHEAFRREARTIAQLQHPHIIDVHDFGIERETPYLVMEYTPNGTLRSQNPKGTCLPFEQIVTYVKQIASALDYAHERQVIHRDIKPENLLLNNKHEVALSDFGIAVVQPTLASLSTQSPAGTPLYMAPEQIRGKPCAASDQYALGVMVYEWLCGQPPFRGVLYEVFNHHLHSAPPDLCTRLPDLPPAVEDAVFGALAKNPEHRFTTVLDFATVLEEAFFATRPLSLREVAASAPEETRLPLARVNVLPASSPSDHDHTDALLPPRLMTTRRIEEQEEHAPNVSSRDAPPTTGEAPRPHPVSVACVCAPSDRRYLEQWETHLLPLQQAGYLTLWSQRQVLAGASHLAQIDQHPEQADLLVLLLSADFFASQDCLMLMHRALRRHQLGETRLIPLLLRPVPWRESPLASLACVPPNSRPVTEWTHQDAAFDACAREIRRLIGRPITSSLGQSSAPAPVLHHQNRQRLLKRVRSFWITGVLEESLYGAALLALGLQEQSDAVADPWHLVVRHPQTAPRPMPAGTRITQVYDSTDGKLLLLGAPGSGKTTLLLALARDLLERAECDELYPLPVVFNLSSWAMKQQPLAQWLMEELVGKYQVPRKLGHTLVDADQILPLLDGLDEVAPRERTACIKAINLYQQEHGMQPLVVCSRSGDYLEQVGRLQVQSAVEVQPLSPQQIEGYLQSAGEPVEALRIALHRDPDLQELAMSPLMLTILTLAYRGMPLHEIAPFGTLPAKQQQVFATYVERMLTHRNATTPYTLQQTIHWLACLAQQMKRRSQTTFSIEHIQPDWLEQRWGQRIYQWFAVILPGVFVGELVGILMMSLFLSTYGGFSLGDLLLFGLAGGLIARRNSVAPSAEDGHEMQRGCWQLVGLVLLVGLCVTVLRAGFGIAYGLAGVALSVLLTRGSKKPMKLPQVTRLHSGREVLLREYVGLGLITGLSVGVIWGLSTGLSFGQASGLDNALNYGVLGGLPLGLMYGLSYGQAVILLQILLRGRTKVIEPAEKILWSWKSLRKSLFASKHLRNTLLVGLSAGVIWGVIWGVVNYRSGTGMSGELIAGLSVGLRVGLIALTSYWALLGLFAGISNEILPEERRIRPNEGIRRSARNSLLVASIGGVVSGVSVGLSYVVSSLLSLEIGMGMSFGLANMLGIPLYLGLSPIQQYGLDYIRTLALPVVLVGGLLSGLLSGGLACLQHSIVRSLLWCSGSLPWNYPRFLDYAAERILLRKVGGGYIFVHRLLLEYFVSLETPSPRM